jgi:ABC-type multidrug transport system fused ATPase/permease subunit
MDMSSLGVLSVMVSHVSSLKRRLIDMLVVPQHAWVQSGTIRENITFSAKPEDVDEARVEEIIEACALKPEIEMWQDGDQ